MWVDYFSEPASNFWSSLYSYDSFNGTNHLFGMWIDMNEPSVFSGPEITMPKSAMHAIYVEGTSKYIRAMHGEVHNAYGLMMSKATFEGILLR